MRLNLIPFGVMPVMYINQYDFGIEKTFEIYKGDEKFLIPSGYTVTLRATKPDHYGITVGASFTAGQNVVSVVIPQQLTAVSGNVIAELVFANSSSVRVGTINMVIRVEPAALNDSTVISDSDISYAEEVLSELQSISAFGERMEIVESKTDWYVTPQDFGAKGDGVNDDTNAFQALNGKTAYIPDGIYLVSHVEYSRNTALFGSGMNRSIILQKPGADADLFDFADADSCTMTNLSLIGNRNESYSSIYKALLKIRTTRTTPTNYANYCNFEHISIKNAPGSGMVLLGRSSTDPSHPTPNYNWVHQINDVRIEDCGAWCMIDETSDNRFSNLYLSEGNLGDLLCKSSYNMYANVKLDQPYGAGGGGSLSGYDDGALLVLNTCVGNRYINIDMQSAYYVGAKIYNCRSVHLSGDINNIGIGASGDGIGLMIENSSYCDIEASFSWINTQQKRNVEIGTNCQHISINAVEFRKGTSDNVNGSPSTCYIEDPSDSSGIYNTTISKEFTMTNLITNAMCESTSGWAMSHGEMVTIDTTGKTAGTNSFKITGDASNTLNMTQSKTGLTPGDYYIVLAVVNVETASTEYDSASLKAPYVNMFDGSRDSRVYAAHSVTPNEVGKHLLCQIGMVGSGGELTPRFLNYKNNAVSYIGNFMMCKLSDLGIIAPASVTEYGNLYNTLKAVMDSQFTGITAEYDYTSIMTMLNYLMNK